jgi:uncharacterized protein YgbK (DUF1537 family)
VTDTIAVGVQADDLTGACDTGAAFAARGLETLVALADAPVPSPPPRVLVLDTESRALPGPQARERARRAVHRLGAARPAVLYKKVDSTLRGALAAEIAGALEGAGLGRALLTPAFPAHRRAVVDGRLLIDGRPADETAVARDPSFPATGPSVLALVGAAGPHPVGLVPLATVRRGPDAVAARLEAGVAVLVADAEHDNDLGVLAASTLDRPVLLAGSAGLATAVARRLGGDVMCPAPRLPRPLLIVAGSPHPVTHLQLERLEAQGVGRTQLRPATAAEGSRASVPEGADWILATPVDATDAPDGREALAARLAEAARRLIAGAVAGGARARYGTLLLTGGETAIAVCRLLGATGIRLGGELAPGLPYGWLRDGVFAGLAVITKAGGFGDPDALVRVRAELA